MELEREPWELTEADIYNAYFSEMGRASLRAIATAAGKKGVEYGESKTLKELAEKCGEKCPCDACDLRYDAGGHRGCDRRGGQGDVYRTEDTDPICEPYACWEGQQQGYAKGLLEAESRKGICGLCGGPMSRNPHPDAGKPAKVVEVGAAYECIPCNKKALHGWAVRAMQAESKRGEVAREIVEWLKEQDKGNAPYTGQPWASRIVEDYCRSKGWLA